MFSRKRAENVNSTSTDHFAPLVVETTGQWRGNDGQWSTFYINVGDEKNNGGGQNFEVLPSLYHSVPILPLKADWCTGKCPEERGIGAVNGNQAEGFNITASSSYTPAGLYDIGLPYWWMGNQSSPPGGAYGVDLVGVGQASSNSWKEGKMYVAGVNDKNFYLGLFGLASSATNLGGSTGPPVDSILTKFKKDKIIPSVSYGYTAGARYKKTGTGIPGSFILGGYDEARLDKGNQVSMPMVDDKNTSLVVGIQGINYKPDFNVQQQIYSLTEANTKGFLATIDSTLPYLWLPKNVCDQFAKYFGLDYNNETNFYRVGNASNAQNNQQQNAVVEIKIGKDPTGNGIDFTTITLPYAAFDLSHFDAGDDSKTTKYFPIRRSTNGMFVLGRTFLQEAYLITDYERANFTVAAVPDLKSLPSATIVPIYDQNYRPTPIPKGDDSKGLSGGAIAGIVIGILAVALGLALGIFIWWKKRRGRNTPPTYKEATAAEIDTYAAGQEVKHRRISELDTHIPGAPKTPVGGFYGDGTQRKDLQSPFPTISEMDSPPAELYSPPTIAATPHSEGSGAPDYFTAGAKLGRRGATRESTPGTPPMFTPLAELPADDVSPVPSAKGSPKLGSGSGSMAKRDPSATRSQSYIDEVMRRAPSPVGPAKDKDTPAIAEGLGKTDEPAKKEAVVAEGERRPSHTRGASDSTVHSDTTVVSQPTPEELESWQLADEQPRRPLSE